VNKVVVAIVIGVALWLWISSRPTEVQNEETWKWRDWQGQERSITVRRNVHGK
jgi:hypothetical protein